MKILLFFVFFSLSVKAEFKIIDVGLYLESDSSDIQKCKEGHSEDQEAKVQQYTEGGHYSFCQDVRHRIVKEKIMKHLYKPHCDQVMWEDLKNIYGMDFKDVEFPYVDSSDFIGLNNLSYLEFSNSNLECISPNAFKNLVNVTHLVISHNPLKEVSAEVFQSFSQLEHFTFSHNLLEEITGELLARLVNLRYLDLSHNLFTSLPEGVFDSLVRSLSILNLSNNRLSELAPGIFSSFLALIVLDLSHNRLKSFSLAGSGHIMRLDLSYNQLSRMSWSGLRQLVECDISHNNLAYLSWDSIENMSFLNVFHYAGNPLSVILVNPQRDNYSIGVSEAWYQCGDVECVNHYAYISANEQLYKFTNCEGTEAGSECYQLSRKWMNELNEGHSLLLTLRGGSVITQVERHD